MFSVKGPRFITHLKKLRGVDTALADLLALLPRTTTEAAALAAQHDEKVEGRSWLTTDAEQPLRHAMEVRHPSYESTVFTDLLRAHDVAVVAADTAGKWPMLLAPTTDLAYVWLHGDSELYVSEYSEAALDGWAGRIAAWQDGGADVVASFDNDAKVAAPFDARRLMARLGVTPARAAG